MVADACAGSGRLAVVEAAAGLGKTRLLLAARDRGRAADMQVLSARATELERDFPFALARQLFEPALATLAAPTREALFEGAAGAARSVVEPPGPGAPPAGGGSRRLRRPARPLLADGRVRRAATAAARGRRRALVRRGVARLPRVPAAAAGASCPVLLAVACRRDEPGAERALARIATDSLARRLVLDRSARTPRRRCSPTRWSTSRSRRSPRRATRSAAATPSCWESWRARSRASGSIPLPRRRRKARARARARHADRAGAPRTALPPTRRRSRAPSWCSVTGPTAAPRGRAGRARRGVGRAGGRRAARRGDPRPGRGAAVPPPARAHGARRRAAGRRARGGAHARGGAAARARRERAAARGAPGGDRRAQPARDGGDAAGGGQGSARERCAAVGDHLSEAGAERAARRRICAP